MNKKNNKKNNDMENIYSNSLMQISATSSNLEGD